MFTANCDTFNKGFSIQFPNGWTISVQWGRFNYCNNKNYHDNKKDRTSDSCPNAEVLAWNSARKGANFGGPLNPIQFGGWQTPNEVLMAIKEVAAYPKED